ncbi:hypothetical protein Leryth_026501 [Lithospermum erythrorhizon]|nr:hypothetical protein Leryth_026501 [Lithospermum erythrorhizon]
MAKAIPRRRNGRIGLRSFLGLCRYFWIQEFARKGTPFAAQTAAECYSYSSKSRYAASEVMIKGLVSEETQHYELFVEVSY